MVSKLQLKSTGSTPANIQAVGGRPYTTCFQCCAVSSSSLCLDSVGAFWFFAH